MKLYRIHKWNDWFENSRSRKVADLGWVPIPNRHDGECYSAIVAHPDGAKIYSAWILMLQVVSKCHERGTLVRDNLKPHTPATLSLKTRAPQKWFEVAIAFLTTETDWLVVEDIKDECHADTTTIPPEYQPSAEERKKEGKERKGDWEPSPLMLRFNKCLKRRNATKWSEKEIDALKEIGEPAEEDLTALERYYTATIPPDKDYRRRDLITVLNNFNGEVDRARKWTPAKNEGLF